MNIHTVTLPDGRTAKRTSQGRTYAFVVIAEHLGGRIDYDKKGFPFEPDGTSAWVALSWSSRRDLAEKDAAQVTRTWNRSVQVVPCTVTTKTVTPKDPQAKLKAQLTRRAGDAAAMFPWTMKNILAQDARGDAACAERIVDELVNVVVRSAHAGNARLAMNEGGGR